MISSNKESIPPIDILDNIFRTTLTHLKFENINLLTIPIQNNNIIPTAAVCGLSIPQLFNKNTRNVILHILMHAYNHLLQTSIVEINQTNVLKFYHLTLMDSIVMEMVQVVNHKQNVLHFNNRIIMQFINSIIYLYYVTIISKSQILEISGNFKIKFLDIEILYGKINSINIIKTFYIYQ